MSDVVVINGVEYEPDTPMNVMLITCKCGWTTINNELWAHYEWQEHAMPHPRKCGTGEMRPATAAEVVANRKGSDT